ncbi:MAG: hypothetical protein JOZ90_04345 [Alphaproteobacteria bacterium]|nr:hypothetical protein [Alphaproteobacteria bacterium]MBV9373325.1 hypothetical protein [Alphaproteobacteria bacterium]MBV9900310.1 hypothetical protein [Alphaproteobacteria bacterium]
MSPTFTFSAARNIRLELPLRDAEGEAWVLNFSAGMERFIGAYPRLAGIDPGGPLLRFRLVGETCR